MGTGQDFIEKTRFPYLGPSDQYLGKAQPPLERKDSGAGFSLPLPGEARPGAVDLTDAIARRRSVRTYATTKMPLATLSYLLWCSQGVQSVVGQDWTIRSVPSAGARHALETYLLVNRVDGVEPGLYHYAALSNRLFRLQAHANVAGRIRDACLNQPMVTDSAAFFIWAADRYRMTWRYVGVSDLTNIMAAVMISDLVLMVASFPIPIPEFWHIQFPLEGYVKRIFIVDGVFSLFFIGGMRVAKRVYLEVIRGKKSVRTGKRTLILGAGNTGEMILRDMAKQRFSAFYPVGLLDNDTRKIGVYIHASRSSEGWAS
jgi:SagB-type dehydrogenase family enzyme